jgi:hypothetical protein
MYSATIQPEDFVASPLEKPFEEHKFGGPPVFCWQRDKLFETNYKCSPNLKFISTKFILDENVQSAVKLLYVSLFHFHKSLSSLPNVCMKSCAVGTTITGTHLSLRMAVGPTQTVNLTLRSRAQINGSSFRKILRLEVRC